MNAQEIINLYIVDKESIAEISRQTKLSTYKVKKILTENNITIRSRKEQNILTNKARTNQVNHNYFSNIDSTQKAWLLGFLMADGWVEKNRNRINIELSSVDKEILEKIQKELNIKKGFLERETNKGFSVCRLTWTSEKHKTQLAKYGIINRKTYAENHLPIFDNQDLTYAFILGYFDGDGSISINDKYIRFRICAHRDELLKDIQSFLQCGNISKDKNGLYEYAVSTQQAAPIFEKLYSLKCFSLERKRNKFLEYKKSTRA